MKSFIFELLLHNIPFFRCILISLPSHLLMNRHFSCFRSFAIIYHDYINLFYAIINYPYILILHMKKWNCWMKGISLQFLYTLKDIARYCSPFTGLYYVHWYYMKMSISLGLLQQYFGWLKTKIYKLTEGLWAQKIIYPTQTYSLKQKWSLYL